MRSRSQMGFILLVVAMIVVAGGGLVLQRSETRVLRLELEEAIRAHAASVRLQAENDRLKSQQIRPEELERLRSDHAALPRLRAELSDLKKRASAAGP